MKKTSAPVVGQRLRRTLGALLAIGFATTWWKFVPTRESAAAAPIDPPSPPPATLVERVPSQPQPRVVVIAIPVLLPFALPVAPTPKPRPHKHAVKQVAINDVPTHRPFAIPPPGYVPPVPEVPVVETPPIEDPPIVVEDPPIVEQPPTDTPTKDPEPHIRTRSS